jgi:hypothetical protein
MSREPVQHRAVAQQPQLLSTWILPLAFHWRCTAGSAAMPNWTRKLATTRVSATWEKNPAQDAKTHRLRRLRRKDLLDVRRWVGGHCTCAHEVEVPLCSQRGPLLEHLHMLPRITSLSASPAPLRVWAVCIDTGCAVLHAARTEDGSGPECGGAPWWSRTARARAQQSQC